MAAAEFIEFVKLFEFVRDVSFDWLLLLNDDDDAWFDIDAANAAIEAECLFDWLDFFDEEWELLVACCIAISSLCNTAGLYGFGNDLYDCDDC